ncbi:cell division protein ZapA [Maritalea mediterranea]|uniref:Cell division protein ZapA n=1 Tax=Maritalea mediterranea TaxID=2909667 RepID=A0ABS9EBX9_9HYPH|nr:cell division protein ZapA [Maritalea mediterranea]MCF4099669.1 cell division protein ZapA [Maritalea mediterranea]
MADIQVEIDGRKYRMACEDGQEGHVRALADRFSAYVEALKSEFGQAGDVRLTVMAALTVMDDMKALEDELQDARGALEKLSSKCNNLISDRDQLEANFANQVVMIAERVETLAKQLELDAEEEMQN